jgi:hypothetical protein
MPPYMNDVESEMKKSKLDRQFSVGQHCDPSGRQEIQKYRRSRRKSWASILHNLFCLQFETWWVRMEESDLADWEAQEMTDHESYGIKGWVGLNVDNAYVEATIDEPP